MKKGEDPFDAETIAMWLRHPLRSPEGDRFLMIKENAGDLPTFVVILNWLEELERRVPTD